MILFLYGADTFRSRQHLNKMIEKFRKDRDPQGMNVVVVDATKDAQGRILEELGASPFLAEKRMVVIERLLSAKQPELQQTMLKKIEEQVLPASTIVVVWEEGNTFKTKDAKALFDRLQVEKYAQEFEEITGAKLQAWIAAEAQERGGKISHDAARYLVEHVGNDVWRLNSVIDQLIAFAEGRDIAVSDVEQFVDPATTDNIFALVDAIVQRNKKRIYPLLEAQYAEGNDAGYIFAMLVRQFRILLEIKDVMTRTGERNDALIAKQLGVHPFVAKKSMSLVQQYSMDELKHIYTELLDLDIGIKTGRGDQKTLLDIFIHRLCA